MMIEMFTRFPLLPAGNVPGEQGGYKQLDLTSKKFFILNAEKPNYIQSGMMIKLFTLFPLLPYM